MWHWLQHFFGVYPGDSNSTGYLFWSGSGSDLAYLSFLAAALALYRRHNCRVRWCWRIGRHEFTDPADGVMRLLCWRHHPDVKHKNLTAGRIGEIQKRRHLYLGKQPGKG